MDKQDKCPESAADRRRLFETEVERLLDRLYGTALRLTRSPDDAEDVVAEAVGRAWACLDDLRDTKQIEGWLFRILHNTFISSWRRRRCRQDRETELDLSDPDSSESVQFSLFQQLHQPFLLWWGTPEDRVVNEFLGEDIQRALDSLADEFRVVIVMVELHGYAYREVSEMLDIPMGTVRSRLARARSLLQKVLWERAREAGIVQAAAAPEADVQGGEE